MIQLKRNLIYLNVTMNSYDALITQSEPFKNKGNDIRGQTIYLSVLGRVFDYHKKKFATEQNRFFRL